MTVMSQAKDEFSLINIFMILWTRKWVIVLFTIIPPAFAASLSIPQKQEYRTNINYSINVMPPFRTANQVQLDFDRLFFSEENFSDWPKKTDNLKLSYNDLVNTYEDSGTNFVKENHQSLVSFNQNESGNGSILVRSGEVTLIAELVHYAEYTNSMLTSHYVEIAENSRFVETASDESHKEINPEVEKLSYFLTLEKSNLNPSVKNNVLYIKPPIYPKKVPNGTHLLIFILFILGGIIGTCFVLLKEIVQRQKQS